MKFDTIKNPNYVATIVRVAALEDLEGLDNLKGLRVFGMQALVSKDTQIGEVGVLFSTEVQLSEPFARLNNLHRHTNLNADPAKMGYLEDSRRVKAIKLRGHRSDSIFMSLADIKWPDRSIKPDEFNVGDTFDSINGHEILRKYVIKEPGVNKGPQARVRRVDLKVFPLHIDSENYWRNQEKIPAEAPVVVTQKLHGTSVRYGKVPVAKDPSLLDKVKKMFGLKVGTPNFENRFVVGSRMVVKSIDYEAESAGKQHYYAEDLWSTYAKDHNLHDLIPDGYLVYGEIVGYLPDGKPIQKNYTYHLEPGQAELYVYRVATVTPSGVVTDLSWPATKAFSAGIGLKTVPEFWTTLHENLNVDDWIDKVYYDDWVISSEGFPDTPVPLSDEDTVDEGICVRYDGPNGIYILKAKSPIFLGHESKLLDEGGDDVEAEEAA